MKNPSLFSLSCYICRVVCVKVVGVTSSEGILDADGLASRNCRCDALYKEDKFNEAALVRYRQSCDCARSEAACSERRRQCGKLIYIGQDRHEWSLASDANGRRPSGGRRQTEREALYQARRDSRWRLLQKNWRTGGFLLQFTTAKLSGLRPTFKRSD